MHFVKRKMAAAAIAGMVMATVPFPAYAESSSEIQKDIDKYKSELSESEETGAELETQITDLQAQAGELYSEIETLNIQKQEYIEAMSERIVYFYLNGTGNSIISALLGAESFTDMLNIVSQQNELHEYDQEQLAEYEEILDQINEKQETLDAQIDALCVLLDEQEALQAELEDTIEERKEDLAEAKASEKSSSSSSFTYAMSSSSGVLTKSKGVVYYNGHRETYYSQRVLPGTGLNIPGRHVDPTDGTVRNGDGYICVASSDLAKGTVVETSLGMGKVYDSGCASGTIDIYTDW